jgi:hypothetical protein
MPPNLLLEWEVKQQAKQKTVNHVRRSLERESLKASGTRSVGRARRARLTYFCVLP